MAFKIRGDFCPRVAQSRCGEQGFSIVVLSERHARFEWHSEFGGEAERSLSCTRSGGGEPAGYFREVSGVYPVVGGSSVPGPGYDRELRRLTAAVRYAGADVPDADGRPLGQALLAHLLPERRRVPLRLPGPQRQRVVSEKLHAVRHRLRSVAHHTAAVRSGHGRPKRDARHAVRLQRQRPEAVLLRRRSRRDPVSARACSTANRRPLIRKRPCPVTRVRCKE